MSNALVCQAPAHTPSTFISPNKIRAETHSYPLLGTLKNIYSPPLLQHTTAHFQPLARFFRGMGRGKWEQFYLTQSTRSTRSFLYIFDESLKYRQFRRIGLVSPLTLLVDNALYCLSQVLHHQQAQCKRTLYHLDRENLLLNQ